MFVKFLEYREMEDGEGVVYEKFKAGQVYELNTASARRWITRNAAVEVKGRAKPEGKPVAKPEGKPVAKPADGAVHPTSPKSGKGKRRSYSGPGRV